jgi:thiosulfate/3-mercaptopyruvate sulfurtransferase
MAKNWLSPQELHASLADPSLRIFDVRFDLKRPEWGRAAYLEGHLPGAQFLDLDRDLSGPRSRHGGRHPLPDWGLFAERLRQLGLGAMDRVVAYDSSGGMFAARLWWMLRHLGHARVQLLDGGFPRWQELGLPVTAEISPPARGDFTPRAFAPDLVEIDQLEALLREGAQLIDARSPDRYRGENETIDPVAGHIPSALNFPHTDNLSGARLKQPSELGELYRPLRGKQLVVYCGSGVSAAMDVLALDEIGIAAKLYAGSWSDYVSYPDRPVARGEQP